MYVMHKSMYRVQGCVVIGKEMVSRVVFENKYEERVFNCRRNTRIHHNQFIAFLNCVRVYSVAQRNTVYQNQSLSSMTPEI